MLSHFPDIEIVCVPVSEVETEKHASVEDCIQHDSISIRNTLKLSPAKAQTAARKILGPHASVTSMGFARELVLHRHGQTYGLETHQLPNLIRSTGSTEVEVRYYEILCRKRRIGRNYIDPEPLCHGNVLLLPVTQVNLREERERYIFCEEVLDIADSTSIDKGAADKDRPFLSKFNLLEWI